MASNYTNSDSTENITEISSSKTKDDFLNEILMCGICLSRMSSPGAYRRGGRGGRNVPCFGNFFVFCSQKF
jgi:hypothetical protein